VALRGGKIANFYDFSGGANCRDAGYLIDDTECVAAAATYDGTLNCYWDNGVRRRRGTSKVNSSAVTDHLVNGIRFYRSSAPAVTTIVAGDYAAGTETQLLYLNGSNVLTEIAEGTTGTKLANGRSVMFTSWKDKLYCASGGEVVQVLSYSGAWARANITGLTYKPQTIYQHRDRLWAAGGDMPAGYFECCAYDNDASWAAGDGEAFYAGHQDGDPIMQFLSRGDNLIVYKNDSLWLMEGDNLYNWFEKKRNRTIGCSAPLSAVDIGFGHIFLSADNVYFFDGTSDPVNIGDKIKPWLDAIPDALRPLAAACYHNGYYRLAFAKSTQSTYNDFEVILDLRQFKQGKIAWWPMSARNIGAYIPAVGPSDNQNLYYADGSAGTVQLAESGTQDSTTNIRYEFHTKYFTLNSPNRNKIYERLKVDTSQGVGSWQMNVIKNLNDEFLLPVTAPSGGAGSTFGAAVLGTSYWTSQANSRLTTEIPLPPEMDGDAISFQLTHEGNYDNVVAFGFSLAYALRSF
jgi:hypothetical protein